MIKNKITKYIYLWKNQGYKDDISDEVPEGLMRLNLAPSYKAICIALLKNDHNLISLGMSAPKSRWYNELKKIEIDERIKHEPRTKYT